MSEADEPHQQTRVELSYGVGGTAGPGGGWGGVGGLGGGLEVERRFSLSSESAFAETGRGARVCCWRQGGGRCLCVPAGVEG